MADPDLRYTPFLGLPYPAADLDPWDDKYVEQMAQIDEWLMHESQRQALYIFADSPSYYLMSWDSGTNTLTITALKIFSPRFGGVLTVSPGSHVIPDGSYLSATGPNSKWVGDVALPGTSVSGTPSSSPREIIIGKNEGGTFMVNLRNTIQVK
jgi:hypothetical protein